MRRMVTALLLFSVLLAGEINSQNKLTLMNWGGRLGLNYASVFGDDAKNFETRIGFVAGLFTQHKFLGSLILQPELNYTSKGSNLHITTTVNETGTNTADIITKLDYIEIPILLKYPFGAEISDRVKFNIFLGPFIAFNINSTLSTEINEQELNSVDLENVSGTDVGIAFGTGVGFKVDNVDLLLELRYTLSFPSYDNSSPQLDLKNGAFSITTGFLIN